MALIGTIVPASAGNERSNDVALLLGAMNQARLSRHLAPLHLDPRLCRVAYDHAVDMRARNYFDHDTPEGLTPFERMAAYHIRFGYAGENLAVDRSARVVFRDFWGSLEHRTNMLERHYQRVGIASIQADAGTIVVEDFSD